MIWFLNIEIIMQVMQKQKLYKRNWNNFELVITIQRTSIILYWIENEYETMVNDPKFDIILQLTGK